ncbi:Protein N-acetyltransferase, RimJ/RimL family [Micromonospora nigra]|uniref:Protein N-acetyltransferase, RimJ/RimL family n=1 Tax=Micromonospora nigra TaxID=145857 RepID=A0A1C6SHI4_9ACTN|nr:GNAT family N-acetyltransferase [Micromonospora nigra]SCL28885.1 Protein N-acetyltransferase, RimJ/RimL family [Micromonospora nigra]
MIPAGVRLDGDGVVLREWSERDLDRMVEIFDDPEIAYRVPVATPFDRRAAEAHLDVARRAQAAGERLCLAITTADDDRARGEVMLALATRSIGYVVGPAHRGLGLASRAVRLLTRHAHEVFALPTVCLQIEADNAGSLAVARATGYQPVDSAPEYVEDKGRRYALHRWEHRAPTSPGPA